ncbi:LOW QUALITY PROTEIN: WD repeat-containing protein 87-like [Hippopotamus amphibius kiboko]|uniref:LOW QUALITY PROTEIN: WD repeat-containing protein 87-like n=1 Tax=Hippopotamus amphibius kiboko TaxID=575201 RepID=UPI0025956309|nr:LOW QUALITY PROTEIN: WD repeat-containing protein 87-like [Hippopotamus amphibius kiboko]
MIEKIKFHVMDQVPPIQAMVHTGSYHMLIAYCGDMRLWLFGDHRKDFTSLGSIPCRFSISCLCYDSETEILLSGTLGAVVTWFILPNGRGLQMAQTVPMPGGELVQGFSLNAPRGSLLALCENKVRVLTQLEEVKKFNPITSGSTITCSFTCVSQGYFYAGNKDGEIHAWGLDRGNFLYSFQAHSSSVICVQSQPDTHTLLTAGREGVVKEWDLAFGNLLRQLDIDKDLQKLQFIDNTTFFCQTDYAFSLYHLPCFYSLFSVCGSAPQQVQRVCCGHNWTRILCATKDGLLRFLSPITGDLLVITWPLLVMDKAVAWAYDSDREELFVATDSSEVLVFDATCSPCTAKYLVCTSVKSEDRIRCLAYGQSHLGKGLVGLMFCGHDSGIVRILSHYSCARIEKTVHSGAVLALSTLEGPQEYTLLCSYGMDNTVYLTEAVLQGNKVILQPVGKILCGCPLKHVILLPGSVGAITENHRWCLWHYKDLLTSLESKQSSEFKETKCLHQCAITSFDVCLSLKLFVTGGIDGSVRIWDFHGRLITELDSALHFGPLCFANNRGDLLLTFNQSLYLVSCLKLLPPAQLIHLAISNNADEIQEAPKPFLPSFFFSFEKVFVPKFVYFDQGMQELQGLEALDNKRVIAFDNTVPHVVEEERRKSSVIQEGPKLHFLEDKDTDFSTLNSKCNHPPRMVPPQLWLASWDGLKPYHELRRFFGRGQQWPFPPDGYIPNSVIRARLWPEGTPIFLCCGLYPSYQQKDWDMTELSRRQTLSPVTPVKENIPKRKRGHKPKQWKQTFFDTLVNMANQNWMGRKLNEGLINTLIKAILNHIVYCSIEQYKTYISVLAQIFASYQVSSRLHSESACRLLEDTTHSNPQIREIAWEGLERLGFMSHLFAIPLAVGLMDSDENVRAKALYLMIRVTGIQTKSMLVSLLKRRETFQEMQEDFIGETSLDQLLGIQAGGIQYLLTQVEQRLNENLTLSHRDEKCPFSLDISRPGEPEALDERTLRPFSEPVKIPKLKERMTHVTAKSRNLIKKDMKVSRKQRQAEFSPVLVTSEHEGEQREAKESGQIDTQDVALEPEPPLSTFSPVTSQDDVESEEVMLEATKAMESTEALEVTEALKARGAVEATGVLVAIDQHGMKDYEEVIPMLERQEHLKRLWERAVKKGREKVGVKFKETRKLEDVPETTAEEPKKEVIQVTEQEDAMKKLRKSGRGLSGTPGRVSRSDTRSWRDDICYLVTSRIASSHPGMLRDLGQELVELAQAILAPQEPSWDLFQEICPLLKDSSELDDRVMEETPVVTEEVVKQVVKEEGTVGSREQGGEKVLKKGKVFSKVKKKKVNFLEDDLVLEKRKFKKYHKKKKCIWGMEEHVAEEAREREKLAQEEERLSKEEEGLSSKEGKQALERGSLAEQEIKLTRGRKKLLVMEKKEAHKKKQIQEKKKQVEKQEKVDQKEKQAKKEEKEATDKQLARKRKKLGQKEEEKFGEMEKLSQEEVKQTEKKAKEKKPPGEMEKRPQQKEERALEKRLIPEDRILAKEDRHIAEREKAIAREGTGITRRKEKITQEEKEITEEEGTLSDEERKLAYDIRTKEMGVAKEEMKRIKEESIQEMKKLDMGMEVSSEEKEASSREKDIRKKESHLVRILAKTIREMRTEPLKEIGIPKEEPSFITGRGEIDDQRWEFLKEQEEITKEEKESVQKERKPEDDRLATKERTLTDEESLEEDQRLLEKVQEKIILDKTQMERMLKEVQQQNLLGKKQLKKLLKIIEENKPEKTQTDRKVNLLEHTT